MKALVLPSEVCGRVTAPPSKSYTHRALFIGLLTKGKTSILNPLICEDTIASLLAVREFGAKASWNTIESYGMPREPRNIIDCKRSATTMRFAIAIASITEGLTILTGSESLRRRPMGDLLRALEKLGIKILSRGYKAPIAILGDIDRLKGKEIEIEGSTSSQFISALLLVAPKVGLTIRVVGDVVSRPYIDITLRTLKLAGIEIEHENYRTFFIDTQEYKETTFKILGDYSSASFLLAAGALYGKVSIRGLDPQDVQGDRKIIDVLKEMGAKVRIYGKNIEVSSNQLEGVEFDCKDTPDLFPVISVLGCFAKGTTRITNVKRLKFKETERVNVMIQNLKKMKARVQLSGDSVLVRKSELKGTLLNTEGDHRIAMALVIAALGAKGESVIEDVSCIKDSYPMFFDHLKRLNVNVRVI